MTPSKIRSIADWLRKKLQSNELIESKIRKRILQISDEAIRLSEQNSTLHKKINQLETKLSNREERLDKIHERAFYASAPGNDNTLNEIEQLSNIIEERKNRPV